MKSRDVMGSGATRSSLYASEGTKLLSQRFDKIVSGLTTENPLAEEKLRFLYNELKGTTRSMVPVLENEPLPLIRQSLGSLEELTAPSRDIGRGHERVVRLLLDHGANVDTKCQVDGDIGLAPYVHVQGEMTAFQLALISGDEAITRMLLETNFRGNLSCQFTFDIYIDPCRNIDTGLGGDIRISTGSGAHFQLSPLHLATLRGDASFADLLLRNGAAVDSLCQLDFDGSCVVGTDGLRNLHVQITALQLAAMRADESLVKLLLEFGASVSTACQVLLDKTSDVGTKNVELVLPPLIFACWGESPSVVRRLVESGAEVDAEELMNIRGPNGELQRTYPIARPLDSAAIHESDNVVRLLHQNGADIKVMTPSEIDLRLGSDSLGYATLRLTGPSTALRLAIRAGKTAVVKYLLEQKADVHLGYDDIFKISYHKDPAGYFDLHVKTENFTALHFAIAHEDVSIAQLLLQHGADIHSTSSMEFSVRVGDQFRFSIRCEAPALHHAALLQQYGQVELLLSNGAIIEGSVDIAARFESTATTITIEGQAKVLHLVTAGRFTGMVELLLRQGFDVNAKCTIRIGIGMELTSGTRVGMEVGGELTALHIAAIIGNEAIARVLLDHGADINAKCSDGKTALDLATSMEQTSMMDLLSETPVSGGSARERDPLRRLLLENGLNQIRGDHSQQGSVTRLVRRRHRTRGH
ncbi:ankyrin repeat-containing domain protein, partial [Hypomontagnella submonticulosa]